MHHTNSSCMPGSALQCIARPSAAPPRRGLEITRKLLDYANEFERRPVPISKLVVGTKCGGSDRWSGVTANPAVGVAADMFVKAGAAVLLPEIPELQGAAMIDLAPGQAASGDPRRGTCGSRGARRPLGAQRRRTPYRLASRRADGRAKSRPQSYTEQSQSPGVPASTLPPWILKRRS